MSKALLIASTEFRQFVGTRTFWVSLFTLPVLMVFLLGLQMLGGTAAESEERRFGVLDFSGELYPLLVDAANERNRFELQGNGGMLGGPMGPGGRFLPEQVALPEATVERDAWIAKAREGSLPLELAQKLTNRELFAILIIEPGVLEPADTKRRTLGDKPPSMAYFSATPAHIGLPQWLQRTMRELVRERRLEAKGISPELLREVAPRHVFREFDASNIDLNTEDTAAQVDEVDAVLTTVVPFALVMILFVCANLSAPLVLNSVIEEKTNKIAEVLLATARPFDIMLGKLLGSIAAGLVLSSVYLGAAVVGLVLAGRAGQFDWSILFWFVIFLALMLLFYGSLWAAIGAACSQLKDTQNFSGLAAAIVVVPIALAPVVLLSPDTLFARVVSFIPPFTPVIMLLRIAVPPGVPWWEATLAAVWTAFFVFWIVRLSGRIFRIGFLWQGQNPSLKTLWKWARAGD